MAWYDEVHSSKQFRLGTRKTAVDGREFIYLQGVASVVAGAAVTYDEDGVTAGVDTDAAATRVGPVAVAMAAVDSTTEYGWFGIWGEFTCLAIDAVADNTAVWATSTVFVLDDAATAFGHIAGAMWRSINDSVAGSATIQLNYPFMGPDLSA